VSEPLLRCRKVPRWHRNWGPFVTPGLAWKKPVYGPSGVRHEVCKNYALISPK